MKQNIEDFYTNIKMVDYKDLNDCPKEKNMTNLTKGNKRDLGNTYAYKNIFFFLDSLIASTKMSALFYYFLIAMETIQLLILILVISFDSPPNSQSFIGNFVNLKIKPYLLLYNLLNDKIVSFNTYFFISCTHLALEVFAIIITIIIAFPKLKNNLIIEFFTKFVIYKKILSMHFLLVIELSINLVPFKCVSNLNSSTNYFFPNTSCYTEIPLLITVIINSINIFLKVSSVLFYSVMFNDFSFYKSKLPWSSPINGIQLILNILKISLIVLIYSNLGANFTFILSILICICLIYSRWKCPYYFSRNVTYAKLTCEGIIVSFGILLYFYFNISNKQELKLPLLILLLIGAIFCGFLYYWVISKLSQIKLLNTFSNISEIKNLSFYDVYIYFLKIKETVYLSRAFNSKSDELFSFFNNHIVNCNNFDCFCSEIDYLIKNKELQFGKNSHGVDPNLRFANDSYILIKADDLLSLDFHENIKDQDNEINKKGHIQNKMNFLTNTRINNMKDKYNKIWGKFLRELMLKYLSILLKSYSPNIHNSVLSISPKNINTEKISDSSYYMIRIEYANLLMFLLRNPMRGLLEISRLENSKLGFITQFYLYLSKQAILNECKESFFPEVKINEKLNKNEKFKEFQFLHYCEMNHILEYNMLWSNLCIIMKINIIRIKKLWESLMKKFFSPKRIEKLLTIINSEFINIIDQVKLLENINSKSPELDYKMFKVYGYYLNKIWKWEEEANLYLKKAYNELVLKSSKENLGTQLDEGNNNDSNNFHKIHKSSSISYNPFDVFKLNETGITIINGDYSSNYDEELGKIIYINDNLSSNICNYSNTSEIINKNISTLMPDFLSSVHRNHIIQFYHTSRQKIINHVRPIFILNKQRLFVPIKINVKLLPGLKKGINFVGYITKEHINQGLSTKNSSVGYILTNSQNKILHFDETAKKRLKLSDKMIFSITQSEEETCFLNNLFPELSNQLKIDELKLSSSNLSFNHVGIVNYAIEIEKDNILASNLINYFTGRSTKLELNLNLESMFHSFYRKKNNIKDRKTIKTPSDISKNTSETELVFKRTYRVGVLDHRIPKRYEENLKNPLIKDNEDADNNHKNGYLIYFIVFPHEKTDKIALLEEIKQKEEILDKDNNKIYEDLASVASSTFLNKSSNIQILISSFKSSMHHKKSPDLLKFVDFLFILFTFTIMGMLIFQFLLVYSDLTKIYNLFKLNQYLYKEKFEILTINLKLRNWQLKQLNTFNNNTFLPAIDGITDLEKEIFMHIDIINDLQSNINQFTKDHYIAPNVSSIIYDEIIPFRTYIDHANYTVTMTSLPNIIITYVSSVKEVIVSNDIIILKNLNSNSTYDFDSTTNKQAALNLNLYENFQWNLRPYYQHYFEVLMSEIFIIENNETIKLFNSCIIAILVTLLFYSVINVFLYILSKKIYSIIFGVVDVPYNIMETCFKDALEIETNLSIIIEDDEMFLLKNLDLLVPDKFNEHEKENLKANYIRTEKPLEQKYNPTTTHQGLLATDNYIYTQTNTNLKTENNIYINMNTVVKTEDDGNSNLLAVKKGKIDYNRGSENTSTTNFITGKQGKNEFNIASSNNSFSNLIPGNQGKSEFNIVSANNSFSNILPGKPRKNDLNMVSENNSLSNIISVKPGKNEFNIASANNSFNNLISTKKGLMYNEINIASEQNSFINLIPMKTKKDELNIISDHKDNNYDNTTNNTNSDVQLTEFKLDDKHLKYDPWNLKLQKAKVQNYVLKHSFNYILIILMLFYSMIFLLDYIIMRDKLQNFSSTLDMFYSLDGLRLNLPDFYSNFRNNLIRRLFIPEEDQIEIYLYYNNSKESLTKIDEYFRQYGDQNEDDIINYINNIESPNKDVFCHFLVDTAKDYSIFINKTNALNEFCYRSFAFKKGFILSSYELLFYIKNLANKFSNMTQVEQTEHNVIVQFLTDKFLNPFLIDILYIFQPLMDGFTNIYSLKINRLIDTTFQYFTIRSGLTLVFLLITIGMYFSFIHSFYLSKYISNKTMLLLIPLDYLKKNRYLIANYIKFRI